MQFYFKNIIFYSVFIIFAFPFFVFGQTSSQGTVILKFGADWCGPCRQMTPVIKKLQAQGYPVREINIDTERELARQFGITNIPVTVSLINGKEIDRKVGFVDESQLKQMIVRAQEQEKKQRDQEAAKQKLRITSNAKILMGNDKKILIYIDNKDVDKISLLEELFKSETYRNGDINVIVINPKKREYSLYHDGKEDISDNPLLLQLPLFPSEKNPFDLKPKEGEYYAFFMTANGIYSSESLDNNSFKKWLMEQELKQQIPPSRLIPVNLPPTKLENIEKIIKEFEEKDDGGLQSQLQKENFIAYASTINDFKNATAKLIVYEQGRNSIQTAYGSAVVVGCSFWVNNDGTRNCLMTTAAHTYKSFNLTEKQTIKSHKGYVEFLNGNISEKKEVYFLGGSLNSDAAFIMVQLTPDEFKNIKPIQLSDFRMEIIPGDSFVQIGYPGSQKKSPVVVEKKVQQGTKKLFNETLSWTSAGERLITASGWEEEGNSGCGIFKDGYMIGMCSGDNRNISNQKSRSEYIPVILFYRLANDPRVAAELKKYKLDNLVQ